MKKLFIFLLASSAHAAPWIDLAPDHANLHYSAGEHAQVVVRSIHEPSTTGWKIRVFASLGGEPQQEVLLTRGVGRWISPALPQGRRVVRFEAQLHGPASNPVNRTVETADIQMEVVE